MTTEPTTATTRHDDLAATSGLAWLALRANAAFSLLTGTALAVAAPTIATHLPLPVGLVRLTGIGVALFAGVLGALAGRPHLGRREVTAIAALDVVWVLASVALLLADPTGFTTAGRWGVALVADAVAAFAVAEFLGARRLPWFPTRGLPRRRTVGRHGVV